MLWAGSSGEVVRAESSGEVVWAESSGEVVRAGEFRGWEGDFWVCVRVGSGIFGFSGFQLRGAVVRWGQKK